MSDVEEFKWTDTDAVVVTSVRAIAVYRNAAGDIVVRQEAFERGEDDAFVVIPLKLRTCRGKGNQCRRKRGSFR